MTEATVSFIEVAFPRSVPADSINGFAGQWFSTLARLSTKRVPIVFTGVERRKGVNLAYGSGNDHRHCYAVMQADGGRAGSGDAAWTPT